MDKVYKCLGASNHSKEEREKDDFYSTPASVTLAAIKWLKKNIPECVEWKIWEPAAGNGRMVEALKDAEMNVVAMSDIVDRGYPNVEMEDFLNATEMKNGANCIFTNPPYKCFSSDTECYTQDGWKLITDVNLNDQILSINPETLNVEWSGINKIIEYEVDEDLFHFKKSHMDILCTIDHRMFAFDKKGLCKRDNDLIKSQDIRSTHFIPRTGYGWNGKEQQFFILPAINGAKYAQPVFKEEITIKIEDWLSFFGLWLADGYCRHTKNQNGNFRKTVGIKQIKENADEIRNILNKLPFEYKEYIDKNRKNVCINFEIHNEQLWSYLVQFGKSDKKFVPSWIKDLSKEKLKILLDSYFFGDGSDYKTQNCNGKIYRTISKKLAEDIQEILLKLGYLSHITNSEYGIKNGEKKILYEIIYSPESIYNRIFYPSAKKSKEHYKGKVACLNLKKNGVFLLKRNGMEFVSGNCASDFLDKFLQISEDGDYYVFLGRLQFLEGEKRGKLFDKCPPKKVLIFRKRVDCWKNDIKPEGSGAVCYAWFVFEKGFNGKPEIDWL